MAFALELVTAKANHSARKLDNANRFAHIQHKDVSARPHGTGLENQLSGLSNTHKVARDLWVSDRYRSPLFDLLSEKRHDRPR